MATIPASSIGPTCTAWALSTTRCGKPISIGWPPPASLVLPSGWFKPRRVLELFAEAPLRVRLTEVLERGADFERIVYEPA